MESRTKDSYQTHNGEFLKFDILVVCPNCLKKAIVKSDYPNLDIEDLNKTRVICPNCGFGKMLLEKPVSIIYSTKGSKIIGRSYRIGEAVDPFFQLPLWLKKEFEENIIWAYNFEHLNFIRLHIEAKLRERNGQEMSNRSLGSRLPRWMTAKKNREIVLRKIDNLIAENK